MDGASLCFSREEILLAVEESQVAPICVDSDRQLSALFQQIGEGLSNEDDWQKRIGSLQLLQALAWGDLGSQPSCIALLRGISDKIASQIADLRSQVCKECCKTVSILAHRLGAAFVPIIELFWSKLVRLVSIKVQVMARAADSCIRVILLSCQDQRVLTHILEGCDSKAVAQRRVSLEYLCIIAATWRRDILDKNTASCKAVLSSGLRDADSLSRKLSRLLFRYCRESELWSRALLAIFDDLDGSALKLLQSENLSVELNALRALSAVPQTSISTAGARGVEEVTARLSTTAIAPSAMRSTRSNRSNASSSSPVAYDGEGNASEAADQPLDGMSLAAESCAVPFNATERTLSERRMSVMGPRRVLNSVATAAGEIEPARPTSRLLSGSVRLTVDSYSATTENGEAPRSSTLRSALSNGPRRVMREELTSSESSNKMNINSNANSNTQTAHNDEVTKPTAVRRRPTGAVSNRVSPEVAIENARSLVSDPQWSHRLRAFESLQDLVNNESDAIVANVSVLALQGLQDSHQKIMIEASRLIAGLLGTERGVAAVSMSLQDVLSVVFVKLSDSRALIRDAAASLIGTIRPVYPAETLVDFSLKLLVLLPETARLPALQFICGLIPSAKISISDGKSVREIITKLCWLTTSKESSRAGTALMLSVKKILSYLWEYNAEAVCREIMKLSFHQQSILKSYLRTSAADYEAVFLRYSKTLPLAEDNTSGKYVESASNAFLVEQSEGGIDAIQTSVSSPIAPNFPQPPSSSQTVRLTPPKPPRDILKSPQHRDQVVGSHQEVVVLANEVEPITTAEGLFISLQDQTVDLQRLPKIISQMSKISSNNPEAFLQCAFSRVPGERNRLADLVALKTFSILVHLLPSEVLRCHLYPILPYCFTYLEDPDTMFRQASLMVLVDLYSTLRNEILPHLTSLTGAQRKLLLIYAEKRNVDKPNSSKTALYPE